MKDELKLFVFSLIMLALSYAASALYPIPFVVLLILAFYFTGFAYIFNQRLIKAYNDTNKNKFTQAFMGLTGIKILLSLILLVCFLSFFKENRLHIGVCTMSYYFLYTVFEVWMWRGKLSNN